MRADARSNYQSNIRRTLSRNRWHFEDNSQIFQRALGVSPIGNPAMAASNSLLPEWVHALLKGIPKPHLPAIPENTRSLTMLGPRYGMIGPRESQRRFQSDWKMHCLNGSQWSSFYEGDKNTHG